MNYAEIHKFDIANGPGVRVSLFVSGCPHHCKGCFNSETWPKEYGQEFTDETMKELLELLKPDYIEGFSVLGGEPLAPYNVDKVKEIVKRIKEETRKPIWLWTGYIYENLNEKQKEVLKYVDTLIEGPFVEELKDYKIQYAGSSNQRVLRLKNGKIENSN